MEAIQSVPDGRSSQSKGQAKAAASTTEGRTAKVMTAMTKGQAKVTSMLLVVSFAWLVLTTPFAAVGFIVSVGDVDAALVEVLMPLKAAAFLLMYTNHAVNFYLYCLTGCRFRQELGDMLADWKRAVVGRCGLGERRLQLSSLHRSTRWTVTTGNGGGVASGRAAAVAHGSDHPV